MLIHEAFLIAAGRYPNGPALCFEGQTYTYSEVESRATQLGASLAESLPAGARVAIHMRKSPEAIIAMLACLLGGLAYVPLDSLSPRVRRRQILVDSGAQALIVDRGCLPQWQEAACDISDLLLIIATGSPGRVTHVTRDGTVFSPTEGRQRSLPVVGHGDTAYILYTSGSTGRPKGVVISHQNAAAFVHWARSYFDVGPGDNVAVHAPLHFDLPVFDIYVGLSCGAAVYPVDEQSVIFPQALFRFLRNHRISVLYLVPSALFAMLNRSTLDRDGLPALRLLLCAGEELHAAPLRRVMSLVPQARVFNLYGPVETNVVTVFPVTPEALDRPRITIGRPISNTRLFLVDADGRLVTAIGEEGEILVCGPSVSPGYLNFVGLTDRQPSGAELQATGERCYQTGDFAHWDEDGNLCFRGRRDTLVKTRGYRVDLGEVEATLAEHSHIAEVAVKAVPHESFTNLLLAYVVAKPGENPTADLLKTWCRGRLPSYMVPAQITILAELPRTSTGKIARGSLPNEATRGKDGGEGGS